MQKKKLICLAFAALLPVGNVLAEESAVEEQQPPTAAPEATVEQGESDAASAAKPTTDVPEYGRMSMEERMKEREKRYEELKKRAEEAGVMLPEHPPWRDREAMMKAHPEMQKRMEHRKMMQAMTPEERDAYRMARYQEMRERANELGIDLPDNPPWKERRDAMAEEWAKHQEVIKGMTDEERAACHAMHRRHMREMGPGKMMRGKGMRPPMYDAPMRGYGYGPGPYAPYGNFWGPEQ
jgi:hypothetical protein